MNSLPIQVHKFIFYHNFFIYFDFLYIDDTPLIAQFAANDTTEYLSATEMIYPYVDGIDLNCGCPQHWAMSSGYGSALLKNPELMKDLTSTIRRNFPSSFSVSVKIRVQKPIR